MGRSLKVVFPLAAGAVLTLGAALAVGEETVTWFTLGGCGVQQSVIETEAAHGWVGTLLTGVHKERAGFTLVLGADMEVLLAAGAVGPI